ncbi:MAG: hypothetical protein ICV60_20900 [Pyrinomonadaceae bacterium]|nr:hypothetical protein [Pyrinomonadaceae bacterium]
MDDSRLNVAACETPNRRINGAESGGNAGASSYVSRGKPCYAPVFEGSSGLVCLILSIIYLLLLVALIILLILTFGSSAVRCAILQVQFRLKHCGDGNTDPAIPLGDPYAAHVHSFRMTYGKDSAWEQWMLANRNRYQPVFERAANKPGVLAIAFRYDTAPIAYNPPWASETEHMHALETMCELTYAGYNFQFNFNGDTTTSYANAIAGIPTNSSHQVGKDVFLYYETIFGHEFGHVMLVLHHYDTVADIGTGQHMPPGETRCMMDRTINQYCSACRTALFIPLNVDNAAGIDAALDNIHSRYPY